MLGNQQERCQLRGAAGGNLTGFGLCGGIACSRTLGISGYNKQEKSVGREKAIGLRSPEGRLPSIHLQLHPDFPGKGELQE